MGVTGSLAQMTGASPAGTWYGTRVLGLCHPRDRRQAPWTRTPGHLWLVPVAWHLQPAMSVCRTWLQARGHRFGQQGLLKGLGRGSMEMVNAENHLEEFCREVSRARGWRGTRLRSTQCIGVHSRAGASGLPEKGD